MNRMPIYALAASVLLGAAVALPAMSLAQTGTHQAPAKAAPKAPGAKTCIDLARIDHSEIVDDSTILFHMLGGQIYQNKLPYRCFGLKFEDGFAYATSLSQLCSTDIIHVLHRGTACGLGMFTPYTKPAKGKTNGETGKTNDNWAKPK